MKKTFIPIVILWIMACLVSFITSVYLPDKVIDWKETIIYIIIFGLLSLFMIPLLKKLDKRQRQKPVKIEIIGFSLIFYLSMILFKTHFVSNTIAGYYLWVENIFPILMILAFIRSSINVCKDKKIVFVETKANKRAIGAILLLIAIFFLTNKPFEELLPKLFSWIEVTIAYVALFFSHKLDPIIEIKEDS